METKYSIKDIIEMLCGKIEIYGSTRLDEETYKNLNNYVEILEFIIDELGKCSKYRNDNRFSVSNIGTKATVILTSIKEMCDEYTKDESEVETDG